MVRDIRIIELRGGVKEEGIKVFGFLVFRGWVRNVYGLLDVYVLEVVRFERMRKNWVEIIVLEVISFGW